MIKDWGVFYTPFLVGFHPTLSRHAKAHASMILAIWLIESVFFS